VLLTINFGKTTMRSFKDTIKSWRVEKDLGLHQVAPLVGITRIYLERIEEGKAVPPQDVVRALAKVLETDEESLLQLWRSSCEQPVAPATPTEPSLSPEAEERRIFGT
jgi:transcriptional regulator with XRE-family HTH domain